MSAMTEDLELLRRYATEQSEAAFAELTARHVDLVYSAALRGVRGDILSAQDVTQQVFTELARQANRLSRHPALVGWLYTTTRLMAMRVNRTEQRRSVREQEAHTMNELLQNNDSSSDWAQLRPVIEEAMHELSEKDRHAVLLRFFRNQTLGQVGAALNLTENAARMRVDRALERLRVILARHGITTTTAALGAAVSIHAVHAAPAAFAATLSGTAIAASAVQASTLLTATHTIAMTTLQKTILAGAIATAVGTGIFAVHQHSRLSARIQTLQEEHGPLTAQLRQLEQERAQASNQVAALSEENAQLKSRANPGEVLKLRGEVGVLRQRAISNQMTTPQTSGGLAKMLNDPAMKEYMVKAMRDKMKSLYGDFIAEQKLTPEQTDEFVSLLSESGTKMLARMSGAGQGNSHSNPAAEDSAQDISARMLALLGEGGSTRFKQFSEELPARATLALLRDRPGATPLSPEQTAGLIQIIKAEPSDLTQGIVGGPDKAFLGSQADVERFLQQVAESNQRILHQAAGRLNPDQLSALEEVLTKGIEARRLQGAAFFPQH